jgi:hypothetical protein
MAAIVPSYLAKVARAKKHLVELEDEITAYAATNPYMVREVVQGKKKRKRRTLVFTLDPADTDIPIVAADVIYNLRSGLDHLMGSLVPAKDRRSVMFPIFWQGVWEPPVPGENEERCKARGRWSSSAKTLGDEAVAVLKRLQPPDSGGNPTDPHLLEVLNRLSNADRHTKLPVVASGLREVAVEWTMPDGGRFRARAPTGPRSFLEHDAEIADIPYRAVDVQIKGTPVIAIRIGQQRGHHVRIPNDLRLLADLIEDDTIPSLAPHVRG